MEASNQAADFIPSALASFGIEADEIELAVIGVAHELFWAPILELLEFDASGAAPERDPDLSQPPAR